MSKASVKKGDTVKVIAGREKGKTGKVARVMPRQGLVVIEKLNMVKRHSKPTAKNRQGGIVDKEAPIHWSNVVRTQAASATK